MLYFTDSKETIDDSGSSGRAINQSSQNESIPETNKTSEKRQLLEKTEKQALKKSTQTTGISHKLQAFNHFTFLLFILFTFFIWWNNLH